MSWQPGDLTIVSGGAPPALAGQRIASHVVNDEQTQHVFYRATDGPIVELWWKGPDRPRWGYLTTLDNNAPPVAGDPTSHVFAVEGTQHMFYVASDNRIVELWWKGSEDVHWGYLSQVGDTLPGLTHALASHAFEDQRTQHVFYRDINQHIIELWWFPGDRAHLLDLTDRSKRAPLASGDPTSHLVAEDGTQHVFYTSVDNQIIELWWRPGELPR